ncbi:uncharacterized protein BDZ99DRAFT_468004 [Mytilinidion resinicola]|uniref:Uncharacterized protein n=1 Tax=Mytilinidion resinicola TaxID=574789 RepID=A0A6A6Y6T4_9PEZI|nr:uncharacterized protein BDZ99DRAFT_468004 [Mytilinidion resinicola]KAF2803905.1 hypothetical protein BDZ99DRAFT_468004 [Mytilinidion resinicola]
MQLRPEWHAPVISLHPVARFAQRRDEGKGKAKEVEEDDAPMAAPLESRAGDASEPTTPPAEEYAASEQETTPKDNDPSEEVTHTEVDAARRPLFGLYSVGKIPY